VFYQPVVDVVTGEISGLEALVRWQHPRRGLIDPAEFISVAEESGLIAPLSEFVLGEATRQLRRWHDHFPERSHLDVTVNFPHVNSPSQIFLKPWGSFSRHRVSRQASWSSRSPKAS
jgi:EAL domain-containing protein (putative c-di-GMP-specific phosphodiesterase class I)